ncbi:MAG: hypothetical protein GY776_19195 [Alteromonas sp.]|nr:hypothetical protein [Alteromonas sp.]
MKKLKHWDKNKSGDYTLTVDDECRVVGVSVQGSSVEVIEFCDNYFSVDMPKHDFIEALRELADELEAVND